jgi:hypothetical protein
MSIELSLVAAPHFRFAFGNPAFYNGLCGVERDGSGGTELIYDESAATNPKMLYVLNSSQFTRALAVRDGSRHCSEQKFPKLCILY